MKRVVLTIAMILALTVGVAAQDDATKMWNFYLGAGAALPTGDLGDGWNLGLHGTGAFGYVVGPGFQILGKIEYHTFGIDDGGLSGVDGGSFNALMFGGAARYNFPTENSKISPFILGGLGIASATISDLTVDDPILGPMTFKFESETKLYIEVGAGLDIASGETMSFFVQGRYVSIQTEGSAAAYIPFTFGLKF